MSNLLPETTRKRVWADFRSRLIVAGSLAAIVLAAFAFLSLLPAYVSLSFGEPPPVRTLPVRGTQTGAQAPDPRIERDRSEMLRMQNMFAQIAPLFATTSPSVAVASALEARPDGVRITRIVYESGILSISGEAAREQLNAYRAALSQEAPFTSVSVPVGALVGAGGGKFTVTLSGNF